VDQESEEKKRERDCKGFKKAKVEGGAPDLMSERERRRGCGGLEKAEGTFLAG